MTSKIVVLVDALHFYVSCERSFQETLRNRPTIVAGNNDTIIVALSPEAKKLGLYRGQLLFQCRHVISQYKVNVFSSNYALYDSMSKRLMALLMEFMPRLEMYSIDEAFGEIAEHEIEDLVAWGNLIKTRTLQWLGLPVRISFARSKTLAKLGSTLLKADEQYQNVIDLTSWSDEQLTRALEQVSVADVFGIGPKYTQYLQNYGLITARHLRDADERWIKKQLTVLGARIQQELKGIPCFPLQTQRKPRLQIVYAKTFGRVITDLSELEEAVSEYTARAARKLREQESLARRLTIFVTSSHLDPQRPAYSNEFSCDLRHPTAFTPLLLDAAQQGTRALFREGVMFKKAGIILSRITPLPAVQLDLFGEHPLLQYYQEMRLMALVDAIHVIWGRDALRFAAQGTQQAWRPRQEHLSRRFTTRWSEILTI